MEGILVLDQVSKRFGRLTAVDRVSFALQKGELFTLLGPSGCGKTTTLRLIGGLERPDGWGISCRDQPFVDDHRFVPPDKRRIGMVFQSLALWPHMTVAENLAYPLQIRHVAEKAIDEKVRAALELVGLTGFEP